MASRPVGRSEPGRPRPGPVATDHPSDQVYLYDPQRCPWTATWNVIGEKWKGILWWRLSNGLGRFGELQRAIPQISKKMLTQTVRKLERNGLVERRRIRSAPPGVEYRLTELGETLLEPVRSLSRWAEQHTDALLAAQAR